MASSSSLYGGEDRGAGGKLRRERKQPPAKPYDRPIRNNNGWISRIVGGATRFLPSFFSPSLNRDDRSAEVEQNDTEHHVNGTLDLLVPKSSEEVGPSEDQEKSGLHIYDKDKQDNMKGDEVGPSEAKGKSELHLFDNDRQATVKNHSNGQQLDIEQLIKEKTFSKEEIDRLMAILHARVVATEPEQLPSVSTLEEHERSEKLVQRHSALIDKKEELNKFEWTSSTHPHTSVQDTMGASPIDIARAYMGSRPSEKGLTPTINSTSRTENLQLNNEFSTKSLITSPITKAPICWPGAMTRDQDYSTPQSQSQKSGYGFRSSPRTPYSRTTYTKSKSRLNPLRNDTERFPSIPSVPFHPSRTPLYGKSVSNMAEGSYGSGGPIRRVRNKSTSATPTRDSPFSNTSPKSPWTKEPNSNSLSKKNPVDPTFNTPNIKGLEKKPHDNEAGIGSVHPHSSKSARHILEQLHRPVTLKEKSQELKFAVEWKSLSQSNNETVVVDDGNNKTSNVFGANVSSSHSVEKVDSLMKNPDQAINNNQRKRTEHESQNTHRKPILPSISINKPCFPSETNVGFTFPITTKPNIFTEPPTPSIMPSFNTTSPEQPQPLKVPSNSAHTLANKITIAPPVVPLTSSTSNVSVINDASIPKFKFGSGKGRLSFALDGDDVVDVGIPKFKFGSGEKRLDFGSIDPDAVCC